MANDERRADDRESGDRDGDRIPTAEKAMMAISAAFTVGLFVFALWHAVSAPGAVPPRATVVDSQTAASGEVVYTVELRNPGDAGLVTVTVSVPCTQPPIEIVFEHVPPGSRRVGTAACPAGRAVGNVSVTSWVQP